MSVEVQAASRPVNLRWRANCDGASRGRLSGAFAVASAQDVAYEKVIARTRLYWTDSKSFRNCEELDVDT